MAYDSRTDAPRTTHWHSYCRNESTKPFYPSKADDIAEGLAELAPERAQVLGLVAAAPRT